MADVTPLHPRPRNLDPATHAALAEVLEIGRRVAGLAAKLGVENPSLNATLAAITRDLTVGPKSS